MDWYGNEADEEVLQRGFQGEGALAAIRCDLTLGLMTVIDATFLDCPWYGSRQMARHLRRAGHEIGRLRARRLMAKMGLTPIYQRPRTSDPHPQHRVYPYLLRKLAIERPTTSGAPT